MMSTSFAHFSVEKILGERTAVMVLEESSAIVSPLNGCSSNVVQSDMTCIFRLPLLPSRSQSLAFFILVGAVYMIAITISSGHCWASDKAGVSFQKPIASDY